MRKITLQEYSTEEEIEETDDKGIIKKVKKRVKRNRQVESAISLDDVSEIEVEEIDPRGNKVMVKKKVLKSSIHEIEVEEDVEETD